MKFRSLSATVPAAVESKKYISAQGEIRGRFRISPAAGSLQIDLKLGRGVYDSTIPRLGSLGFGLGLFCVGSLRLRSKTATGTIQYCINTVPVSQLSAERTYYNIIRPHRAHGRKSQWV